MATNSKTIDWAPNKLVLGSLSKASKAGSAQTSLIDSSGNFNVPGTLTVAGAIAQAAGSNGPRATSVTTTTPITITAGQSGTAFILDKADGITFTLPAPVVGLTYDFFVKTTATSSSYKIITDAGTTLLAGNIVIAVDNTASKTWVGNGTNHISVDMTAASTNAKGSILGGWVRFTCISATLWSVNGLLVGGGTSSTPFATS